ncbi:MAG: hypothetical protein LBB29_00345 [Holosporaceae bacterium]|jgi:hypothetical protein|nr:hypothetical protein [Holosporaceae bacterium]
MKYISAFFLLLLLSGCNSPENEKIDTEALKQTNKLLIPPILSKSSASVGKGHNVKQKFDRQAESEIRLPEDKKI